MKRMIPIILILSGLWFTADGLHERWAVNKLNANYATRKVDANGIREGCAPFVMGEGSTALILVHGFADSPALYRPMAEILSQQGYTCRALRLEGFAGPLEEQKTVTAERWKQQVIDAVLAASRTHDQIFLIGHSLGCAISLHAMPALDGHVDGIILMTPMFKVSSDRSPIGNPRLWFHVFNNTTFFTRHIVSVFGVDTQNGAGEAHPRETVLHKNIYTQTFKSRKAALEVVQAETLSPLLMILAGEDKVVDNDAAEEIFLDIQSERKERILFKDSGHVIPIDTPYKETTKEIERFIQSLTHSTFSSSHKSELVIWVSHAHRNHHRNRTLNRLIEWG